MGTPTHTYLIIGCGHFGSRAAKKLFQKDPHSKIIVVDKNKKALQKVSRLPIETHDLAMEYSILANFYQRVGKPTTLSLRFPSTLPSNSFYLN